MATVAEDIADKLATLGLGVVGTTIFIGVLPERPDEIVSVNETGGTAPEFGFGTDGLKYETPNVQIMVRGARGDYEGPRTRIDVAFYGLAKVQGQTLGSTYYHMIAPSQSPFPIQRDDDARIIMAFNALCKRSVS